MYVLLRTSLCILPSPRSTFLSILFFPHVLRTHIALSPFSFFWAFSQNAAQGAVDIYGILIGPRLFGFVFLRFSGLGLVGSGEGI